MDNFAECPVCLNIFSSVHRPKSLQCGHSFCEKCVENLTQKETSVCPMCNVLIGSKNISINFALLDRMLFYEVLCDRHRDRLACFFSVNNLAAFCMECASNSSGLDLAELSFTELGNALLRKGFEIEYKLGSSLSSEVREKLSKISQSSNKDKITILKEISLKIGFPQCSKHSREAVFIDFTNGAVLCSMCQVQGNELSLTDRNIDSEIAAKISQVLSTLDSVTLTPSIKASIKSFLSLSLSEKLSLLTEVLNKRNPANRSVVPALCDNCQQEFSFPNNLPKNLQCQGRHFICEICSNLIKKCPLDNSTSQGVRIKQQIANCHSCSESFTSSSLPILLPCGTVQCSRCTSSQCLFCGSSHSGEKTVSRFYLQISDFFHLKCVNDEQTAKFLSLFDRTAYCQKCGQGKNVEKIEELDLENLLITECQTKSSLLGNRLTPVLAKTLQDLPLLKNSKKLEFLKLISSVLTSPGVAIPSNSPGKPVPELSMPYKFMQRFRSILPNPDLPQSPKVKAWYIKRNEGQVEVFSFQVSSSIVLLGITVACPIDGEGIFEYLDIFESDKPVGRFLNNRRLKGLVEDLAMEQGVQIKPTEKYDFVFKIDAEFLYKGNPLDRTDCSGSDGKKFEVLECKRKGLVTNGQGSISGPLIRLIYR